jgi:predicted ATPase
VSAAFAGLRARLPRLSVSRGWFDMDAARAVAAPDADDIVPLVLRLADRSLISARRDGGAARYRCWRHCAVTGSNGSKNKTN